jgi:hypothetical protein
MERRRNEPNENGSETWNQPHNPMAKVEVNKTVVFLIKATVLFLNNFRYFLNNYNLTVDKLNTR